MNQFPDLRIPEKLNVWTIDVEKVLAPIQIEMIDIACDLK